jgi:hypothetical protein
VEIKAMAVEPKVKPVGALQELGTLLEALNQVPDARHARGVRYGLGAVLGLCILAFMCGRTTLSGVWRFGADHRSLLRQLGIARARSPSVATLSRLLGGVDADGLQRAVAGWLAGVVARARGRRGRIASVDGKTSRASGVHVLNIFLHDVEQVVWAAPVEGKANEITAFKQALGELLKHYPFLELVVGDAMFAGAPLCELLIENGRHYLFQIKADQPDLLEKMGLVFAPQLHRPLKPEALEGEKKRGLRRRA